ncbi:RNA-binding protein 7 [Olea europaea var. sylvestris]|uniref:RNA-binding protein 7 n=1 Tax=Olea europaea var. sylvestris TaxID=158386 RepID=UPI000C1CE785|nr:RNA-binding protein 7 [Olea europaea var. sylvestris]
MAENPKSSVYVGNLDERVSERVLYDILIQAGRVVDLYIPRDKETDKPKGYAFAQYESEEIAEYAVKLFTGLVTLYNRTLKFAISGQDKPSANLSIATPPAVYTSPKPRPYPETYNNVEFSPQSARLSTLCRSSEHQINYVQVPVRSGVSVHQPNGYRSHYDSTDNDYRRRLFGAASDSISHARPGRYDDRRNSTNYHY